MQSAEQFAKEHNLIFFETSAKEGSNVQDLFQALVARVPDMVRDGPSGFKLVEMPTEAQPASQGGGGTGCGC